MLGLMQDWPLLCHRVIDHAAANHGEREVVSRSVEGPIHTTTYAEIRARALKVAQRLDRDGIRLGDRVATLAWNTWRHSRPGTALWASARIYHTVNPRLFPEQIVWIVNHAEDRVMMVDLTFVPLLEKLADRLPTIERYVVLTDAAHMPERPRSRTPCPTRSGSPRSTATSPGSRSTRTPPPACATRRARPAIRRACSIRHRSNVLHSMIASAPDAMGVSSRDVVLPVVPMFHANAGGSR